jgi:hypothetical protein
MPEVTCRHSYGQLWPTEQPNVVRCGNCGERVLITTAINNLADDTHERIERLEELMPKPKAKPQRPPPKQPKKGLSPKLGKKP